MFFYVSCTVCGPTFLLFLQSTIAMQPPAVAKNVIVVMSGKGGVGKSTVATQLALQLAHLHGSKQRIGLLDIDLCGPSVPYLLGISSHSVHQSSSGWVPVTHSSGLAVMSIGFLLSSTTDAVIWRGPKKNAMIKQFFTDVVWNDLDYLVIDTPPGTSDEHISLIECLRSLLPNSRCASVIVTTPQAVAVADVRREISLCRRAKLDIIGVVENMSGYECPHCSECTNVFSSGGGESLAELTKLPFLCRIPIRPTSAEIPTTGAESVTASSDQLWLDLTQKIMNHYSTTSA